MTLQAPWRHLVPLKGSKRVVRRHYDALVIGGGFFGCEVALEMKRLGASRIGIVEREAGIMRRASYVNQARVHNGYHYPRSIPTAERSRVNFERFVEDYGYALTKNLVKLYAIARQSRVNAGQFEAFCHRIGAPCRSAVPSQQELFDPSLIEEVFLTTEYAFDSARIAAVLARQLEAASVEFMASTEAHVTDINSGRVTIALPADEVTADWVFNCTYAELEYAGIPLRSAIKKEMTEILLIRPPPELAGIGVTVMDGPFFSTMPFPARRAYSLTHVRYTPHESTKPGEGMPLLPGRSNRAAIVRDSARYLPCLSRAEVIGSLFEVKAVLVKNEDDDGRPIMVEQSRLCPRIVSILGAKIDNIYDVRQALQNIVLPEPVQ
jgi:glycine/D-amino acid oxidase-like deaminating enzyme